MNPITKISLKDIPPLSLQQRKTLKLFESEHNIVKARLSFKKIKSVGEALSIWGRKGTVEGFLAEEELTFSKVETLYVLLYNELVHSFITSPKAPAKNAITLDEKAQEIFLGEIWNVNDAQIESDYGVVSVKEIYDSILPPHNAVQKAVLYPFQNQAAKESFWKITQEYTRAILCPGKVGEGKTFYVGQLLRWLLDSGYVNSDKNFSPWRILYVTKATIVEQTKEELEQNFGLRPIIDITVTNYEQLRADLGGMMIEDTIIVEDGIERHNYKWRPYLHPMIFVWDECHSLKNEDSIQSRIAQAVNDIEDGSNVVQIFMSATPFSRVSHAKAFACATRKKYKGALGGESSVTNINWNSFAKRIASPADPNDYCKAAIKRLLKEFSDYIVPFKNVRQKHKAVLRTISIDFETEADRKAYALAWEQYLEAKAKISGTGDGLANSRFLILVQFLKFRQAAELIRSHYVAKLMYKAWQEGFAPVYACNFKASIAKVVSYLCSDFNIDRSKISLIWGGDKAFGGSEEKYSKEAIHNMLAACMRGEEVSMKILREIQHQLMTEASGLSDLPAEYELGAQSKDKRWREIKRFQSGKSEFCMFSYKSGGAGLSLHQNKETLRPRKQYNSPTYNEMEMQQAEGRTCRLTSLNDVEIDTLVYRGTIEVPVMARVTAKRQCLNVVMGVGANVVMSKEISNAQERELEAIMHLLDTRSKDEKEEDDSKEIYEDDDENEEN